MSEHRRRCRGYSDSYRLKLTTKKIAAELLKRCDDYEEQLDIFNLVLIRQRVDLEVEISGKRNKPAETSGGWFSGWWGGGKKEEETKSEDDICRFTWSQRYFSLFLTILSLLPFFLSVGQFKTAMTSEEKEKLYEAIGYHEGGNDLLLPENYVAITMRFNLKLLEVCVRNEVTNSKSIETADPLQTVLSLQVKDVLCELDQRPAASGLKWVSNFLIFNFNNFLINIFACVTQGGFEHERIHRLWLQARWYCARGGEISAGANRRQLIVGRQIRNESTG